MIRIKNIKELAALAGVSTGTVSRALANSTLISKQTRDRIQALAAEHDFRPNVMARNLRIQRTGAVGVVIPLGHEAGQNVSDPFFMTILAHLADALSARSYDMLLSRIVPVDDAWLDRFVDSGRVDGVIVIGQSNQTANLDRIAARYRPMAVWGGHMDGQVHCSVGTDNRRGGYIATRHLLERGSRRLAFFGDPDAPEIGQRLEGCRKAMAEAGLAGGPAILPAHLIAEAAHPEIAAFLGSTAERPDGIVAASDVIAMSALRALSEQGLSAPDDVRVIGFDDLPLCQQTVPQLSSIRQDIARGARELVDMLFRRIAGEETARVIMEPELVVRMSS